MLLLPRHPTFRQFLPASRASHTGGKGAVSVHVTSHWYAEWDARALNVEVVPAGR